MHRIYAALIEIAAALVFIIPLFGLYGKYILHDLKKTLIYIVLGSYFVSVLSLVGFPSIDSMKIDFTINVIPFVDMISDFVNACDMLFKKSYYATARDELEKTKIP